MRATPPMAQGGVALLLIFFPVILLLLFGVVYIKRWEGQAPEFQVLEPAGQYLGRRSAIRVKVRERGMGLRSIGLALTQGDKSLPLFEQSYEGPSWWKFWRSGPALEQEIKVEALEPRQSGFREGAITLSGWASDWSWRSFGGGNKRAWQQSFTLDFTPPRLEVLSGPHYINQGGSEALVYRVSPDATVSGVLVGDRLFPPCGDRFAADPNLRLSLFAFSYDLPESTPVRAVARDEASNEIQVPFSHKVFAKNFRQDNIHLTDPFLANKVPEILSYSPEIREQGNLLKSYLEINGNLRRINNAKLEELSRQSAPQRLWSEPFLQLSNSQVEARFADFRTYFYQGEKVDHQVHLGFDLAVRERYPIEASNAGKVIYADYLGIYGRTVLIDHGCGLGSIYGHLSSVEVKAGDSVNKGQVIGRSGATGLAGGDHLHYSMILHGVQVNPIEWWDRLWIEKHLNDRLRATAKGGGLNDATSAPR